MAKKQYLILLDIDARKRHHHITEAHQVIQFTVQLEIKVGDAWFLKGDFLGKVA